MRETSNLPNRRRMTSRSRSMHNKTMSNKRADIRRLNRMRQTVIMRRTTTTNKRSKRSRTTMKSRKNSRKNNRKNNRKSSKKSSKKSRTTTKSKEDMNKMRYPRTKRSRRRDINAPNDTMGSRSRRYRQEAEDCLFRRGSLAIGRRRKMCITPG